MGIYSDEKILLKKLACKTSVFSISVENENHCDFTKLREMLIRTNMEDLRDTTHGKHYEVYRKDRLKEVLLLLNI